MEAPKENLYAKKILLLAYNAIPTPSEREDFRKQLNALDPAQQQVVLASQSLEDLRRLKQSYERFAADVRPIIKPTEDRIASVIAAKEKMTPAENKQQEEAAKRKLPVTLNISQQISASDQALISMATNILNHEKDKQFVVEQAQRLGIYINAQSDVMIQKDSEGMFNIIVTSEYKEQAAKVIPVSRDQLDQMVQACMAHAVSTPPTPSVSSAPPVFVNTEPLLSTLNFRFSALVRREDKQEFITLFNALPPEKKQEVLAKQRIGDLEQLSQSVGISVQDKQTMTSMITTLRSTPISTPAMIELAQTILKEGQRDAVVRSEAERIGIKFNTIDNVAISKTDPLHFKVVITDTRGKSTESVGVRQEELSQLVRNGLTMEALSRAPKIEFGETAPKPVSSPVAVAQTISPPPRPSNPPSPLPASANSNPKSSSISSTLSEFLTRAEKAIKESTESSRQIIASNGTDKNAISRFESCMKTLSGIKEGVMDFARKSTNREEHRQADSLLTRIEGHVKAISESVKNYIIPTIQKMR